MIAYYDVIWVVNGVPRLVHTMSGVAAEELLELLLHFKSQKGYIENAYINAVEEEVYF